MLHNCLPLCCAINTYIDFLQLVQWKAGNIYILFFTHSTLCSDKLKYIIVCGSHMPSGFPLVSWSSTLGKLLLNTNLKLVDFIEELRPALHKNNEYTLFIKLPTVQCSEKAPYNSGCLILVLQYCMWQPRALQVIPLYPSQTKIRHPL